MVKLVCIDVDGTLVGTGGQIAERVWPAVAAARAAGVHLALCSGRPAFGLALSYARRLEADGWHIFQNGTSLLNLGTGESRSASLAPAVVAGLRATADRTGRILELYTDNDYTVERVTERAARHAELLGVPFAPRSFDTLVGPIVRAQWLIPFSELEAVQREPHEGVVLGPSTSPAMPDTCFVNLTPTGVDKASAVRTLAGVLGCSLAEVMFVGDGLNDLEAMRVVGVPVAMANADAAVRALTGHHVGDVDEGGLADALAHAVATR
ncbi:MAG: HAD family phosphatase [Myxococcales bacterium]|nr:MAG: HAD family phosphatase [Myxococcales bacterium]